MSEGLELLGEMSSLEAAEPRDLSVQQADLIKETLKSDLFAFAWFIFKFKDMSLRLHGELAALLQRWGQEDWRRLMVMIPRNHLKTSLCTIANSLWQVVRDPDAPIAIFNEKQDNAAMWVRTIRDVAQSSPLFIALWGRELMPPGKAGPEDHRTTPRWWKWNDDEIMFQRSRPQPEASISALGIGSASAGRHWPKIIYDDLISEDAMNSPTVMATTKTWVDAAVYLERPAMQGQVLFACTPWAYDDTYAHVLRKYPVKLYKRAALEDPVTGEPDLRGEPIFPELFSRDVLLAQAEADEFQFMAQGQCTPRPGRDRSFDPRWVRWGYIDGLGEERPVFRIRARDYDSTKVGEVGLNEVPPPVVPLAMMNKAVLWDPAPTEEGQIRREKDARNGMVAVGVDPWGRKFVLEAWAGLLEPYDTILQAFKMLDNWGTDRLGIEEVIFSKLYRHWVYQICRERGKYISVVRLKPGSRDKGARIRSLIPGFKNGLYYLNTSQTEDLAKELAEYPYSGTVDLLDALSYDHKVGRPETLGEWEQRISRGRWGDRGRSSVTGY